MLEFFRPISTAAAILLLVASTHAQSPLPSDPVALDSLAEFRPTGANWKLGNAISGDPRHDKTLTVTPGTGVIVANPTSDAHEPLFTAWDHGDLEADLEFMLPPGSNSGVYLQGRYEVQLFDSWGKREVSFSDCGGIYERWDQTRPTGQQGSEGHAPIANASRAPGLWQKLHIEFEAPRFDANGTKTKNARFTKVLLNGFVVQENVEVTGPTRGSTFADEKPLGPLMIQGDHGSVALRNLAVKRFDRSLVVTTEDLHYRLYNGGFNNIGEYDTAKPSAEGVPAQFAHSAVEKSGKFALVFTGSINVPRDGLYRFSIQSRTSSAMSVDDKSVVTPLDRGSQPGTIQLSAGKHTFRTDLVQSWPGRPFFEVSVEGPAIAPQPLTARSGSDNSGPSRAKQIVLIPKDRVLLQRGFVPYEPSKRLYAMSIGTPAGIHFAYDTETSALLRVWRGGFADTTDMWEDRGIDQVAKPIGPALTLNGKPSIALLEYPQRNGWPERPEVLWSSQGYTLEPDGQPVFLAKLDEISIRDRIAPAPDGVGLTRRLVLSGRLPSWSAWVLLAEADQITPQPDGHGWIIGDREWYLDWPEKAVQHPVIRTSDGKQQLAVPLTASTLEEPLTYTIVW